MESISKHSSKIKSPVEGCVAYHFHGILSTNLIRGSHNLLFPDQRNLSSVLIGVLGGATNLCNERKPLDIVGYFSSEIL